MEASGNSLSLADFPSNWILISPASSAIQNELDDSFTNSTAQYKKIEHGTSLTNLYKICERILLAHKLAPPNKYRLYNSELT